MSWLSKATGIDFNLKKESKKFTDSAMKTIDNITPDITIDAQKDLSEFADWTVPDVTIGQEDQAYMKGLLSSGVQAYASAQGGGGIGGFLSGLFGGSATVGEVPSQNFVERKEIVQQGRMPANVFSEAQPINKNMLLLSLLGGVVLIYFLTKKRKK